MNVRPPDDFLREQNVIFPYGTKKDLSVFDLRSPGMYVMAQYIRFEHVTIDDVNELSKFASQIFAVKLNQVKIIETQMKTEAAKRQTYVLILPEKESEDIMHLMLNFQETTSPVSENTVCGKFKSSSSVKDITELLMKQFMCKTLVMCKNNKILPSEGTLMTCGLENFDHVHLLRFGQQIVKFRFRPRADIEHIYSMDVDLAQSVSNVKLELKNKVQFSMLNLTDYHIHFLSQNNFVEDSVCMGGLVRDFTRDNPIDIYICEEDVISISVRFKKPLKQGKTLVVVKKTCSTAELRQAIANVMTESPDPRSVLVYLNDKSIGEEDNLEKSYPDDWKSGCSLSCGIKKCKKLVIKHPKTGQDITKDVYTLDRVNAFRKDIADEWDLPQIQLQIYCQETLMEDDKFLCYYPVRNNSEIQCKLFQNRILIQVVIVAKRKKINLIIDDFAITTVEDVLRYCGHSMEFRHDHCQGLYENRCLKRNYTLQEEGVRMNRRVSF